MPFNYKEPAKENSFLIVCNAIIIEMTVKKIDRAVYCETAVSHWDNLQRVRINVFVSLPRKKFINSTTASAWKLLVVSNYSATLFGKFPGGNYGKSGKTS